MAQNSEVNEIDTHTSLRVRQLAALEKARKVYTDRAGAVLDTDVHFSCVEDVNIFMGKRGVEVSMADGYLVLAGVEDVYALMDAIDADREGVFGLIRSGILKIDIMRFDCRGASVVAVINLMNHIPDDQRVSGWLRMNSCAYSYDISWGNVVLETNFNSVDFRGQRLHG